MLIEFYILPILETQKVNVRFCKSENPDDYSRNILVYDTSCATFILVEK